MNQGQSFQRVKKKRKENVWDCYLPPQSCPNFLIYSSGLCGFTQKLGLLGSVGWGVVQVRKL